MIYPHFKVVFPVNTTAIVQLMDQGVVEKLKRTFYRKKILRHLLMTDSKENTIHFY
jgi:hypothetical protein